MKNELLERRKNILEKINNLIDSADSQELDDLQKEADELLDKILSENTIKTSDDVYSITVI